MRFSKPEHELDPVTLEIQWRRLITIMDETDRALTRTAFSTIVGESGDFACILMDAQGHGLAQSNFSTTFFTMTLPRTTRLMLEHFPPETLEEGDVLLTNDPWLVAGHLPDFQVTSPVFYEGALIAFIGIVAHMPDIGGKPGYFNARQIYEEGLRIPPCKVYERGVPNDDLLRLIAKNVRVPEQVIGDVRGMVAAHHVGIRRLREFMRDYELSDLCTLAANLLHRSERAMRDVLAALPDGVYCHQVPAEGYSAPIDIRLAITKTGEQMTLDLTGTSEQREDGAMNCTFSATLSDIYVGLKALFLPQVPNNEGALSPFEVIIPEGSFYNCLEPAAVKAREVANVHVHDAFLGALLPIIPERVHAGAGNFWSMVFNGIDANGNRFNSTLIVDGGLGGSDHKDGLGTVRYPGNGAAASAEVLENKTPLLLERKELATDSAGAGRHRGGMGQQVVVSSISATPLTVALVPNHFMFPPPGLAGGKPGTLGSYFVNETRPPLEPQYLRAGDRVIYNIPGGGGYGDPLQRPSAHVARDVAFGYVSATAAASDYGVVVDPNSGQVDEAATQKCRNSRH
jgi:N-methylhydantoinase B/oxoprolinase/acetone carboxylase alpha subunit